MPTPRDVLAASRRDALAVADGAGKKHLLGKLADAAEMLKARLAKISPGMQGSFTHAQMAATLEQVQDITAKLLIPAVRDATLKGASTASQYGAAQSIDYLAEQHKAYAGTLASPLPINEAFVFDTATSGTESTVLRRLASNPTGKKGPGILARYGMETVGHFEGILQASILTKQPWESVKDNLIGASPFLQSQPRFWAERIVRTETMHAYSKSALKAADEANEELGDMVKILSATFDDRTGSDSFAVHGQIRRMEEFFTSWFGDYQHPPNRPNDREIVVPHRISWPLPPYLWPKSDAEVLARWKQEKRKGSPPPRPLMETVDRSRFGKEEPPPVDEERKREEPKEEEPKGALLQERPLGAELAAEDLAKKHAGMRGLPQRSTYSPTEKAKRWLHQMPNSDPAFVDHDFEVGKYEATLDAFTASEKKIIEKALDGTLPSLMTDMDVALDDLVFPSKQLNKAEVLKDIEDGGFKGLGIKPVIVKHGGKLYVEMGTDTALADSLLGNAVTKGEVLDLDNPGIKAFLKIEAENAEKAAAKALEEKAAAEKAAKNKAKAEKAAATKAANKAKKEAEAAAAKEAAKLPDVDITRKHVDPTNVLHKKIGEQAGSNPGGLYEGADGVKRYVKRYGDPAQAHGEAVSNAIYRALGIGAPESEVFTHEGAVHHASKIIEGGKTLSEVGLDATKAKQIMDGFAADVLLANWDVVGMSNDNILFAGGKAHRIDQGGSLLMRAKNGRKDVGDLHKLTEWENFFSHKNPSYRAVAEKLGAESPDDFADQAIKGIKDIVALRDKHGGWSSFVDKAADFGSSAMAQKDRDAVVEMLEKRTKLLEDKLKDLGKPKPKPEVQLTEPGKFAPPKTTMKALKKAPPPKLNPNRTPDNTPVPEYRERAEKNLQKTTQKARDAITEFTDGPYRAIREAMSKGETSTTMGEYAESIKKAFAKVDPIKGRVYRGIGVPPDILEAYCQLEEGAPLHLGPWQGNATIASSSRELEPALNFADGNGPRQILLVMDQHRGIPVETISAHKHELEVLTHPDAHFRVTQRYKSMMRGESGREYLVLHLEEMTEKEIAEARAAGVIKGEAIKM